MMYPTLPCSMGYLWTTICGGQRVTEGGTEKVQEEKCYGVTVRHRFISHPSSICPVLSNSPFSNRRPHFFRFCWPLFRPFSLRLSLGLPLCVLSLPVVRTIYFSLPPFLFSSSFCAPYLVHCPPQWSSLLYVMNHSTRPEIQERCCCPGVGVGVGAGEISLHEASL